MRNLSAHIVFAGGGTAGHLFPGLAVAEHLRRVAPGLRISFAGTGKPFELRHVRAANFEYLAMACRPFPRRARETFRFLADNFSGYRAARRFLAVHHVALVVGLGGYASVPAARAASSLGIPYIILEQNAVPGRATRWLAPQAQLVCTAFDDVRSHLKQGCRIRLTGNPLRRELSKQRAGAHYLPDRGEQPRTLVVLGGSGGARSLNEQVPRAIYKAREAVGQWRIVHQTGPQDAAHTAELYRKLGIPATVSPFFDSLPSLLPRANLAISRAGGTTLAELAASSLPAIVLPYPASTDNHQLRNAEIFAEAGACRILDERQLDGRLDNHLAAEIAELAVDHPLRARMAQAAGSLARLDATRRVSRAALTLLAAQRLAVA